MRISTKGRYALRLMLDLARHSGGNPVSLRDISQRQNISMKYLGQIVSLLTRAGLVSSVRGALGGYYLTRAPEQITVLEILRLTENQLTPAPCVDEGYVCEREGMCAVSDLWKELDSLTNRLLAKKLLSDLLISERCENANKTAFSG